MMTGNFGYNCARPQAFQAVHHRHLDVERNQVGFEQ